jgi:ABC-type spermidine/putrescine transport system permease subunit I
MNIPLRHQGTGWSSSIPYLWLLFFFLLPFLLVLKIALSDLEYGQPPYAPQFSLAMAGP